MLRYCEFLLHFGTYVMLRYCEFLLYLNMKTVLHTMKCENLKSQLFEKKLVTTFIYYGGKKRKAGPHANTNDFGTSKITIG